MLVFLDSDLVGARQRIKNGLVLEQKESSARAPTVHKGFLGSQHDADDDPAALCGFVWFARRDVTMSDYLSRTSRGKAAVQAYTIFPVLFQSV